MTEKANLPLIRFKGFTSPWEQRKFKETVLIERGGSPRPIDDYITDQENGLNWIKIGDAPEMGNYITKTAEKIRPEGLSKTREVYPGDLILSNSMSFGKPYIMGIYGCIHDGWLLIRNEKETFDLTFLCHLLGTTQMLEQYRSFAAGSTVNNLNKELVGSTIVKYPSMQEQKVIGTYFNMIDNLITLHQRKYEKLTNIKKSLLEKMFPTGDENVPKLRFKGFTSPWEQRKFEYYFDERNERSGIGELISVTINSGIKKFSELNRFDSKPEDLSKYKVVHEGDIAYNSMRMWQGASGISPYTGILSPAYTVITPKYNVSSLFFSYLLKRPRMIHLFEINSQGLTKDTWNLKFLPFSQIETWAPEDYDEQTKIGTLFQQLDNLITLHQRMLEKLKNIKKSLLEKMFV